MWSIEWRSQVQLLLETISSFYSKKILMDLIDDREHRPRQHLGFFIYDFYISQNKMTAEGSKAFLKFIAKIVQYLPRSESVEHLHSLHSPVSDGVSIGPGFEAPMAMNTKGEDNACVVDGSFVLKGSAVNRAKQNGRERYNSRIQLQQHASIFRDSYIPQWQFDTKLTSIISTGPTRRCASRRLTRITWPASRCLRTSSVPT